MTNCVKEVKCVVGANYGDEGKGAMVNYFTRIAKQRNMSVLNVLYNGGCQRGHTAQGHIFHCFGSGAILGADTYYTKNFMVNPIAWFFEFKDLDQKPKLIIHPDARVTTPYDVAINQALERKRGNARHGSCGLGIFETRHRCEEMQDYLVAQDFCDEFVLYEKLTKIKKEYFPKRCEELGIEAELNPYEFDNFISCIHQMMTCGKVIIKNELEMLQYESVIFEGGQGLLLSETNTKDFPHLTPSITGFDGITDELHILYFYTQAQFEMCLMTRPYLTRHGAGPLPYECAREDISDKIIDETNMPNEWQGSLRFAPHNIATIFSLHQGVFNHADFFRLDNSRVFYSTGVTCLDQTNGKIIYHNIDENKNDWLNVDYLVYNRSRLYAFYGKDTLPKIYL